jgi:hypothetical protein
MDGYWNIYILYTKPWYTCDQIDVGLLKNKFIIRVFQQIRLNSAFRKFFGRYRFVCLFVCLQFFAILNKFSVIWWRSVVIDGGENPDTLYSAFGKRPPTFRKLTDKLSHTATSEAGIEPTRAGGERICGMRPMSEPLSHEVVIDQVPSTFHWANVWLFLASDSDLVNSVYLIQAKC